MPWARMHGTQYPDPISRKLYRQILVGQKCYDFALFLSKCFSRTVSFRAAEWDPGKDSDEFSGLLHAFSFLEFNRTK